MIKWWGRDTWLLIQDFLRLKEKREWNINAEHIWNISLKKDRDKEAKWKGRWVIFNHVILVGTRS